ncbi:MAG: Glu-tRNA(Gln) amidotransferase subunit GatD [Thermofilaceae archaeon]|nr:Glu-tRNA(Gln) amidotransferase subunit GatD [Thermofilaceae archaeon]MCX8180523.1 Glu-tRNA(Gln) amidotransferase subunit GatD [Thermofilaceae archaeon]MDW8003281.1 Glu-tRNA(Gln) amidotransferase subunit GatD [Thermofilaceae archaeon]
MDLTGYGEKAVVLLENAGVSVFDEIEVERDDGVLLCGVLLPRPQYGDPEVLVLKLSNGYNVGVDARRVKSLRKVGRVEVSRGGQTPSPVLKPGLPRVHFLGTGGTIASRIDYVSGAVYPYFTAEDIYSMVPELEEVAFVTAETLFNVFSEDLTPRHWSMIAERVAQVFEKEEPAGVIVAHGTDTMGYTAAALAFALRRLPGPVVLVGAQRSSDRPSSDSATNVLAATVTAVKAPFAESVVVMHAGLRDTLFYVNRGVRVRKMHTSRRDAFRSVNSIPLAKVELPARELKVFTKRYARRSKEGVLLENGFEEKVALVKFYPGMSAELIDYLVDNGYKGMVIEGTGLGHVAENLLPSIKRAVDEGVVVAIASQCIWGRVNMNVYRRGVELLKVGAIPSEDMLPETAYVKLSWVLARTDDPREAAKLFLTNLAFEIEERSEEWGYPPLSYFEDRLNGGYS